MITKNYNVKCDLCGKFIKMNNIKTRFIPESICHGYTDEINEQYHEECYDKLFLKRK
jgi:hypothetical protein